MRTTSSPQGRAARSLAVAKARRVATLRGAESRALARARRRYRAMDRRVGLRRRTADRGCSRRAHLRARPRSSSSSVTPSDCCSSQGRAEGRAPLSLARNRAVPQRLGASVSATGSHANLGSGYGATVAPLSALARPRLSFLGRWSLFLRGAWVGNGRRCGVTRVGVRRHYAVVCR
jgi:hypothetical protein